MWMSDLDTAESLLIEHIRLPCVLLYDPATRYAYANDSALQHRWTSVSDVERFLSDVKAGLVPVCLFYFQFNSIQFIIPLTLTAFSIVSTVQYSYFIERYVCCSVGERRHRLRGRHEPLVLRDRQLLCRMPMPVRVEYEVSQ